MDRKLTLRRRALLDSEDPDRLLRLADELERRGEDPLPLLERQADRGLASRAEPELPLNLYLSNG